MVFKFVAVLALVAAVKAGIISAPVGYSNAPATNVQYAAAPAVFTGYSAPAGHSQQLYPVAQPGHGQQLYPVAQAGHGQQLYPVAQAGHGQQLYPVAQAGHGQQLYPVAQAGQSQQLYPVAPAAVVKSQSDYVKNVDEYDAHPQYKFGYDVQDYTSGDSKSQIESRDGDVVKGEYSLIDADGYKRTVQYTSDPEHGFNAVVHREPIGVKTAPNAYQAAPAAKTSYSAPVAYASPAAYSTASAVKSSYAAPVATYDH